MKIKTKKNKLRNRKNKLRNKRTKKMKGGLQNPISEPILFTVTGMPEGTFRQFRPNFVFIRPSELIEEFISAVNDYKEEEPPDETVLEEEIKITRIRGDESEVIYTGIIINWPSTQIELFVSTLQVGDRVHIEII